MNKFLIFVLIGLFIFGSVFISGCITNELNQQQITGSDRSVNENYVVNEPNSTAAIELDECTVNSDCTDGDSLTVDLCNEDSPRKCINQVVDECFDAASCDDEDNSTEDICQGSPKRCFNEKIFECKDDDNYCPQSCDYSKDNDCKKIELKLVEVNGFDLIDSKSDIKKEVPKSDLKENVEVNDRYADFFLILENNSSKNIRFDFVRIRDESGKVLDEHSYSDLKSVTYHGYDLTLELERGKVKEFEFPFNVQSILTNAVEKNLALEFLKDEKVVVSQIVSFSPVEEYLYHCCWDTSACNDPFENYLSGIIDDSGDERICNVYFNPLSKNDLTHGNLVEPVFSFSFDSSIPCGKSWVGSCYIEESGKEYSPCQDVICNGNRYCDGNTLIEQEFCLKGECTHYEVENWNPCIESYEFP